MPTSGEAKPQALEKEQREKEAVARRMSGVASPSKPTKRVIGESGKLTPPATPSAVQPESPRPPPMGPYISSILSEEAPPLPLEDQESSGVPPVEIPVGGEVTVYTDLCFASYQWLRKNLDTLYCFTYQGHFFNPFRGVRNLKDYNEIIMQMSHG